ncbi:hypothetical protein C2E23DRAFT_488356 [Lenzites betulinus]|nr:hypothetical protein C2E23DRAFT_488356 [Lenzites betulinus]
MTSPHSFPFSKPAMTGDALSVLVLVEDSAQMAAKWPDVRDSYLPILLENLRTADQSVQIEARWLTASSPSPVASYPIMDAAQCRNVPDLVLGQGPSCKISPPAIQNAIKILGASMRGVSATRHFILVAATGPPTSSPMNEATPSGFDPWDDIALVLKQEYIRLHVILNIGAEMRTYHELFKRSLQLQSNSEVPAWFCDSRKFSVRLSGRPQYVRSAVAAHMPLISNGIQQGRYGNPSPSPPISMTSPCPGTPPTQDSPPATSPQHRKTSTSPTAPRSRGRGSESSNSPPEGGGGGSLVTYLQQMHGLTKKKSYGVKAPKKSYSDLHFSMAGRPILPRLEVPQSGIYNYPSFDGAHAPEPQVLVSDAQSPPRRHSADQLPSASLVVRTNNDDRRARRRGPWLPIAPLVSSSPSSPTATTPSGTLAALQSLASMTPRLPDFGTNGRTQQDGSMGSAEMHDPYAAHNAGSADARAYAMHSAMTSHPAESHAPYPASPPQDPQLTSSPTYFYSRVPQSAPQWSQQGSVGTSPTSSASAPSPSHTSASGFSDTSRQYSDFAYGSSPPSSAAATPLSMTAPVRLPENSEDQPFIITPEIVAKSDADMAEVLRSGALQASMTPALCGVVQTMQPSMNNSMYAQHESLSSDNLYYPSMSPPQGHSLPASQETGYPLYANGIHLGGEFAGGHADGGQWQYGGGSGGYTTPIPDYLPPQGQWYST